MHAIPYYDEIVRDMQVQCEKNVLWLLRAPTGNMGHKRYLLGL